MDISRKTDYALRMLTDLVRTPAGVVSVRSAADGNGVPYSFARSIQHDLSRAGIIESLRGSRGSGAVLGLSLRNLGPRWRRVSARG